MQSTSSEPSPASSIIRTGFDERLRYSREKHQDLLAAFDRSGLSAMFEQRDRRFLPTLTSVRSRHRKKAIAAEPGQAAEESPAKVPQSPLR